MSTSVAMVVAFFYMVHGSVGQKAISDLLSGRVARFMGDTSYAVYLLHLLLVIPTAAMLSRSQAYLAMPATMRFALCATLVIPAAYIGAWGLFRWVEKPGIRLGKRLLARFD